MTSVESNSALHLLKVEVCYDSAGNYIAAKIECAYVVVQSVRLACTRIASTHTSMRQFHFYSTDCTAKTVAQFQAESPVFLDLEE